MNSFAKRIAIIATSIVVIAITVKWMIPGPVEVVEGAENVLSKIVEDFKKYFQFTPAVSTKSEVVVHKETPILELATTSQTFSFSYWVSSKWIGSEKKLKIVANFEGKAGFDLTQNFQIDVDGDLVTVDMPQPKVLSCGMIGGYQIEGESGWWNSLTDDDRSVATNEMITMAREWYLSQNALSLAKQNFHEKFETIIKSRLKGTARIIYR